MCYPPHGQGTRDGYLTFDPHVRGQLWPPSLGVHGDMVRVCAGPLGPTGYAQAN